MRPNPPIRKGADAFRKGILSLFITCCVCACGFPEGEKPVATGGVIDLREWDFSTRGPISLEGEWDLCREEGPETRDYAKDAKSGDCGVVKVPGLWNDQVLGGKPLPGKGRVTYRLRVLRGADRTEQALEVRGVYTDYTLLVNGVQVDFRSAAKSSPKERGDYYFVHSKRMSVLPLREGINEILVRVSNDQYASGGIRRAPRLANRDSFDRRTHLRNALDMAVVGMLLFASVYNILLFFFRRQEKAPLYFGLFCLVFSINIFNLQIPLLSGPLSVSRNPYLLDFITVMASLPLCVLTIRSLFPDEFGAFATRLFLVATVILIIPLSFFDFRTAELLLRVFFAVFVMLVLYCVHVFIKSMLNRRDDALPFFIGFVPLFAGGLNDILYATWVFDTTHITQYGLVLLCVSTTAVISRRFSRALGSVEKLSADLVEKNRSLMELDRLKDQFLAVTSHELRTPLHGMIGLSESMIDGDAGELPPKALESLSLIASSGQRLAAMVNDLLDMVRMQEEGLNLVSKSVDLYALGQMVVRLSLPLVGTKPVAIVNNVDPGFPRVRADEDRIHQVLYNLVGNAVKFTATGSVVLSARQVPVGEGPDADTVVEISVSDTGIGVPDEYKKAIFEPYRQVDGSDTRAYEGTGLGLAIARRIVELHGGTLAVTDREGGGAVFSFTLPESVDMAANDTDGVIVEGMSDASAGLEQNERHVFIEDRGRFENNPAILVVDDDPLNVRIVRNHFESRGCVVKTAPDGPLALEIIDGGSRVDLVLLDIMMPVMSGFEVCRRIRSLRSREELPVIMLTAKNMMSDIDAAFEAGANDYVVKPFHMRELHARVGTMLRLRTVRDSAARGITIRGGNRTYSLTFGDIVYISSHSKSIVVHTGEGDIEVPVLLKEIVHRLPPDIFVRIHKSHIINIRYVHSVSHVLSGRYRVRLKDEDDTELPVGPFFLEDLRKKMIAAGNG